MLEYCWRLLVTGHNGKHHRTPRARWDMIPKERVWRNKPMCDESKPKSQSSLALYAANSSFIASQIQTLRWVDLGEDEPAAAADSDWTHWALDQPREGALPCESDMMLVIASALLR